VQIVNENEDFNKQIDFVINKELFIENIELFTDVDKLLQAYKSIINLILKVHKVHNNEEKPKVRLEFNIEDSETFFKILHCNSKYKKSIQNTLDRIGDDYTRLIKNSINGLCDLYIKADFGNEQYAEINIWNGKQRNSKLIPSFKGVEHILIFKK
jgi:hypothetical protein